MSSQLDSLENEASIQDSDTATSPTKKIYQQMVSMLSQAEQPEIMRQKESKMRQKDNNCAT